MVEQTVTKDSLENLRNLFVTGKDNEGLEALSNISDKVLDEWSENQEQDLMPYSMGSVVLKTVMLTVVSILKEQDNQLKLIEQSTDAVYDAVRPGISTERERLWGQLNAWNVAGLLDYLFTNKDAQGRLYLNLLVEGLEANKADSISLELHDMYNSLRAMAGSSATLTGAYKVTHDIVLQELVKLWGDVDAGDIWTKDKCFEMVRHYWNQYRAHESKELLA